MDKADSPSAVGNHIKTVNRAAVQSRSGPAKASAALFAKVPSEAWAGLDHVIVFDEEL